MSDVAILCVDDEDLVLDSLKEQLRRTFGDQFLYETAGSVDEAWEIIDDLVEDNVQIVIIVSDWLMPHIRGDEFLINVHHKFPQAVKIMLTGQADDDAVDRARKQANLYRYISKPWQEADLMNTIQTGLDEIT